MSKSKKPARRKAAVTLYLSREIVELAKDKCNGHGYSLSEVVNVYLAHLVGRPVRQEFPRD
jgi:hypothetical protein